MGWGAGMNLAVDAWPARVGWPGRDDLATWAWVSRRHARRAQPGERARPAQRGGRGPRAQRADLGSLSPCAGSASDPRLCSSRPTPPGHEDECSCLSGDGVSPPAADAACS